jgi:hypothetical protein
MLQACADVLREFLLVTPPNISPKERGAKSKASLWGGAGLMGGGLSTFTSALRDMGVLRRLTVTQQRDLLDLFTKSAGDVLDSWSERCFCLASVCVRFCLSDPVVCPAYRFEGAPLKGLLGFDAITGNFQSPYTPGSAYVLLHHCFGNVFENGAWGHAMGGMGAITQAMAKEAVSRGVTIELNAAVKQVMVKQGVVRGVLMEDGSEIKADAVVSNVGPKLLYLKLIEEKELEPDFVQRIRAYRCKSGTFRMNVALDELPNFACKPGYAFPPHPLPL